MSRFGYAPPMSGGIQLAHRYLDEVGGGPADFIYWVGDECGLCLCEVLDEEEVLAMPALFGVTSEVFNELLEGAQSWP